MPVDHAGGKTLEILGRFKCLIRAANREGEIYIHVVSRSGLNLLGLNAIDKLNLWNISLDDCRNLNFRPNSQDITPKNGNSSTPNTLLLNNHDCFFRKFPKLFAPGLGKCKHFQAKFRLLDNAVPVQSPYRQIPYAMEKPLEGELSRLESLDIIERISSLDWSIAIILVKKHNGGLRLCADYSTGVNQSLRDNPYPLPNVDSIISKLASNSYFSILDLFDAFMQIEVAEDHRDISTITTPKGIFRFKRLPFSVKTAPAIFQQAMDHTLSGLEGVYAYIDDVVVAGTFKQEYDIRLSLTLQRLEDEGWK